jgi:3-phenylpropionate/trans-cinnamate dioxygenase ferredoxin subunit
VWCPPWIGGANGPGDQDGRLMTTDAQRLTPPSEGNFRRRVRRGCASNGGVGNRSSGSEAAVRAVESDSLHELLTKGRTITDLGQTEVLVVRTRRGIFAVENRCPHLGRALTDADVCGRKLICSGHGRQYDLKSGKPAGAPGYCARPLQTFEITIVDDRLWLSRRTST